MKCARSACPAPQRATSPRSAHSSKNTPSSRKLVLTMAEKLMSDANLAFDRELHSAIAADSPPEALKPGGVGARIQLQTFLRHPSMRALKGDLAEALKQHDSKVATGPTYIGRGALCTPAMGGVCTRLIITLQPTAQGRPHIRCSSLFVATAC